MFHVYLYQRHPVPTHSLVYSNETRAQCEKYIDEHIPKGRQPDAYIDSDDDSLPVFWGESGFAVIK